MAHKFLVLTALVMAGCATTKPDTELYLKVAYSPSYYPRPISIHEWSKTNFGWYLSRDTEFGGVTRYRALMDGRINRRIVLGSSLPRAKKLATPAFILYEGEVNCRTGENRMVATTYDSLYPESEPFYRKDYAGPTEVSQNICLLNWVLEN